MTLTTAADINKQLQEVLTGFPDLVLALVFGSVAKGCQRIDSDLDIAVAAKQALTVDEKMAIIAALAEQTGRPPDITDISDWFIYNLVGVMDEIRQLKAYLCSRLIGI